MKENILNTATDLFLNLGFKSVTMDDIAHEMAISKKTIYEHYSHKTDLVHDVSMHLFNTVSCGVDMIVSEHKNPIEELYEVKKYVLRHLRNDKSASLQQLHKYYPKVHDKLKIMQFDYMQGCVLDNINRGMQQGLYRDNLNVDFVARIYFIGVVGIKDPTLFPFDKYTQSDLQDYYLEYHLRGIVTPKGRKVLNHLIQSNQD